MNSEVARLMAQIQAEHEAARAGLSGLAEGCSRHAFITARTERIADYVEELQKLTGEEEAARLMQQWKDRP